MKTLHRFFVLAFLLGFIAEAFAHSGKALVLNGTDQYMRIPSHDDFNITTTEDFSISLWVKASRWREIAVAQRFVGKRDQAATGNKSGYELWGAVSSTQFYANNAPNEAGNHTNSMSVFSTQAGALDTWVHIGFVVNHTSGKMYLYQNGVQVGSSGAKDISVWSVINDVDVTVGCGLNAVTNYFFQGEIDNLRFWNKALTTEEMVNDQTATVDDQTANLLAAYDFENVKGLTVPDISGGTKHPGTLYNYAVEGPSVISSVKLKQDTNFTGRGNDNEAILKATVVLAGTETVACNSIQLNMDGTTNLSDVESIKIYTTGSVDKFDSRDVSSATLLGTVAPAEGELTCATTGHLVSGTNYVWITYQIKENAKEGNQVDASLVSITTAGETYNLTTTTANGSRTILLARKLLFEPGDKGFKNYRIPTIITAKDGSLVTVTDKRKFNHNDLPADIDVIVSRSTDGGKTWSEPLIIAEGTGEWGGFGDAGLVRTNEEGGLLAIFVGGKGVFNGSTPSTPIRTYTCKSLDNGITWSAPRDITSQLFGSECPVEERQGWYASFCASGNGLLTSTGRIMFVAAVRETSSNTLSNFVYYSDDNGETWNVSPGRAMLAGDESKVTELVNGDLLMSIRNQGVGARYYNLSKDGGLTWGEASTWPELQGPACNGDLIRYTSVNDGYEKNRLLHTIPYNFTTRRNVSVFLSHDEGKTWPIHKSICETESGYSSLTILPDGTIGAYIEENFKGGIENEYSMYFLNFTLDWVSDGIDSYHAPGMVQVVSAPEFSLEGGDYEGVQSLELTTKTEGAAIYYTLDESNPTTSSTLYNGTPISIEESCTVKAIAVKDEMANSTVSVARYKIVILGQYCVWEGPKRGGTDRVLQRIKIEGATLDGEVQAFDSKLAETTQTEVYIDRTTEVLNATMGNELTVKLTKYGLEWMHFYVYIDYNKDGLFDTDTNELVAYTYYQGKDSKGKTRVNSYCPDALPSFVIPRTVQEGSTRMRVKVDWDNIDPCGDPELAKNRGALIDYTINISPSAAVKITYEQPKEGGTFTVNNKAEVLNSGDFVDKGAELTVVTSPAEGYVLRNIKVNNEIIEGTKFNITDNSNVSVEFTNERLVSFLVTDGGIAGITKADGTPITSGTWVELGSVIKITAMPLENYEIIAATINGVDVMDDLKKEEGLTYTVTDHTNVSISFGKIKYAVTFSANEYGNITILGPNGAISNGKMVEHGLELEVSITPKNNCLLTSLMVNGEEKMSELLPEGAKTFKVTLTEALSVVATFELKSYTLTYNTHKYGTITVTLEDGTVVASGSKVKFAELITLTFNPIETSELVSLFINGEDNIIFVEDNLLDHVVLGDVTIEATFKTPVSIDEQWAESAVCYINEAGDLVIEGIPLGSSIELCNMTGQLVAKAEMNAEREVMTGVCLSDAVYLVKLNTGTQLIVRKVMKK